MKHKQYKFKQAMSKVKMRQILQPRVLIALVAMVWVFSGCQQKEDDPQPVKSIVGTLNPTNIFFTSATLNGVITTAGTGGATDHGFVWGESANPDLNAVGKQSLGARADTGAFTYELTGLETGKIYYVRAYVIDAQGTFYGLDRTFTTSFAPSISSFTPTEGGEGDTLTISGSRFTSNVSDITVKIGGVSSSTIVSASETEIKVIVPNGGTVGTDKITVTIKDQELMSSDDFSYVIGTWTQKTNFGGSAREFAVGFTLNGKGYVGLGRTEQNFSVGLNDLWQYDSATDTWTQKANYPGGKRTAPVVWVNQNSAYVGLGIDETGAGQTDFWQYAPGSNSWSKFTDYTGTVNGNGNTMAFILGFDGYVISNTNKEVWQFSAATWTQKKNLPFNGSKVHFVLNDVVYVLATDKKLWKYNATADSWSEVKSFPGERFPNFSFAVNNKGYASESIRYRGFEFKNTSLWEYSPTTDNWVQKRSLHKKSADVYIYSEAMIINNKAYIREGGFRNKSFWEFDPSK